MGDTVWYDLPAHQQPTWVPEALGPVLSELRRLPPLVFAGECRALTADLARAARGAAFVVQAGDCAESFADLTADRLRDQLRLLLAFAATVTTETGVATVKIGRMAGQYAKPRSAETELIGGVAVPVYRGDAVNSVDPSARLADPARMLESYFRSSCTLNLLRAFAGGGYGSLRRVGEWGLEHMGGAWPPRAEKIAAAVRLMDAMGVAGDGVDRVSLYTSHEALLLDYEEALTRVDSTSGRRYDCSAHMVWIGERTRQLDAAHVAWAETVENPVAVKLGPAATPAEALELARRLNPGDVPGRLTFIMRCGAGRGDVSEVVMRSLAGRNVVWMCDPLHGNTTTGRDGLKTRHVSAVVEETREFFAAAASAGVVPAGVHLELTGDDVGECVSVGERERRGAFTSNCDPRLNAAQALRVAEVICDELNALRH